MKNITVSDIKQNNLTQIYNLIYEYGKISKQEIAQNLKLSLPTVTEKLHKLEKSGLIKKDGFIASNVGRKAAGYVICTAAKVSIGVAVYKEHLDIVIIDLKGNEISKTKHEIPFKKDDSYYKEVSYCIKDFILQENFRTDQILGIAFCMQGTTNQDRTKILYGKVVDTSDLEISCFSQFLNFPCLFFHDAKSAANAEVWFNKDIKNALYLSITDYLGGAMINNSKVIMGDNGHCGAIEHVQLNPDGEYCYCGRRGCVGTYCCIKALLKKGEEPEDFFSSVRSSEPEAVSRWDSFLENLAFIIYNFHMLLDRKIIIGGKISSYFIDEDIEKLKKMTYNDIVFKNNNKFIMLSEYKGDPFIVGAALYYIQKFLDKI